MNINFANAVAAYGKTLPVGEDMEASSPVKSAGGFAKALQGFIEGGAEKIQQAETKTVSALSGKADLTDVVTAVTAAEMHLSAIVAVRDKVIGSYKEIMQMPI